ncbi:hypothetical protein F5880DRAFT_1683899 [Lentinula raphanica]|nr:hypothetical protein F5880DRAFT_1683899 [Lentinula raphanica]
MYLAVARSAAIASRVLALLCLGAAVTSTIGALAAHTPSFRVQALQSRSSPPVQESPSKLRVEHVNLVPRVENDAPEEGSKAAGNDANFTNVEGSTNSSPKQKDDNDANFFVLFSFVYPLTVAIMHLDDADDSRNFKKTKQSVHGNSATSSSTLTKITPKENLEMTINMDHAIITKIWRTKSYHSTAYFKRYQLESELRRMVRDAKAALKSESAQLKRTRKMAAYNLIKCSHWLKMYFPRKQDS